MRGFERPPLADAALLLVALLMVFAHLGEGHLANFDDCYYAQKAKEMTRSGDWATPHYDGQVSLDNPPLFLWLMAGSFLAFGVRDYAAILPSALSGVLCIVVLHRLGRRLRFGPFAAWTAAVVLLTTQYFLKYSRHAMFDVFLTLLFLLAIGAYLRAREGRGLAAYALLGVLCGLGVLTKNVLGLFPLAVAGLHLAWSGPRRDLARFMAAPLATLLTIAPWYAFQLEANGPRLIEEHFRWLILERGLAASSGEPGWGNYAGYLRDLATIYWPWLPAAAWGIVIAVRRAGGRPERAEGRERAAWTDGDTARLLLLWLLVVIGVMSVGREKKLWYVMSAFPALALCAALAIESWIPPGAARRRTVLASVAALGAIALWLNVGPMRHGTMRQPELYRIARIVSATVPAGERVVNYDNGYWSIQNLFLFYSDHGLTLPATDPDSVRAALDRGALALVASRRVGEIASVDPERYPVMVRSGDWSLLRGATAGGSPHRAANGIPVVVPTTDRYR